MNIALTGGTGFLGRYLIQAFLQAGHQVTAWRRDWAGPRQPGLTWIRGQLADTASTADLVRSADAVVHAAVFRPGDSFFDPGSDRQQYWQLNTEGSLKLLAAAADSGVRRFVFISSGAVHDDVVPDHPLDETHPLRPNSLYGAYKASVECLVHHFGKSGQLSATALRPTAIYGVDDPVEQSKWYPLVRQVCAGQDVDATGGSKSVHAADVAKAAALLIKQDDSVSGEAFNCCDRMISEFEVASVAKEIAGSSARIAGPAKQSRNQIDTSKIASLGMRFGGDALLRETVTALVRRATQ